MLDMTKAATFAEPILDVASAITFAELPGAYFFSQQAIHECGYLATRYENAVDAYQLTGDDLTLWEELDAIGLDRREIQWHVDNRGQRMAQGYA